MIRPGRTDTAPTAPARARARPFFNCFPSSAVSASAFSQARPHQVSANGFVHENGFWLNFCDAATLSDIRDASSRT